MGVIILTRMVAERRKNVTVSCWYCCPISTSSSFDNNSPMVLWISPWRDCQAKWPASPSQEVTMRPKWDQSGRGSFPGIWVLQERTPRHEVPGALPMQGRVSKLLLLPCWSCRNHSGSCFFVKSVFFFFFSLSILGSTPSLHFQYFFSQVKHNLFLLWIIKELPINISSWAPFPTNPNSLCSSQKNEHAYSSRLCHN